MREPIRDKSRLEHIQTAIERILDNIKDIPLDKLSSNVLVYYGTAQRMKKDGIATKQISKYTGLTTEKIENI